VFRAPGLDQTTVGLNAVVGFQRVEAVELAPVEPVGAGATTKACTRREQHAKTKNRKREGLSHVEVKEVLKGLVKCRTQGL